MARTLTGPQAQENISEEGRMGWFGWSMRGVEGRLGRVGAGVEAVERNSIDQVSFVGFGRW